MKLAVVCALVLVTGCGKEKEKDPSKIDIKEIADEAAVEFARKNLAEIDTKLASQDPGSASSVCTVIKIDMPAIKKADPKLAETIEKRCGRDLAIRSLAVFVEKAEAERAKDPNAVYVPECSGLDIYLKPVVAAGAEADPEVAPLKERHAKACPKK
jgi:hypothetical protein